jgi:hypothetical protein
VVSRRQFSGSWEYLLDSAIFTSPPTLNWSGAALIGTDGSLLGSGSLILRDATDTDSHLPGNMFVPIEALKPILADLIKSGRRVGPARPWLGVAADEVQGRLVVVRVSPEGPADVAGIQQGDIILAVGGEGVRSQADFYRKLWARGAAGSEIPLRLLQGIDIHEVIAIISLRADMLSRMLPYTPIADRCKIVKSWLEVRGQLGTYRIHLGWGGAALIAEKAVRWLKIPQKVLAEVELSLGDLPIDLDYRTELALRKAYVLADDWKITSSELVRQLIPE